jgi:hypothetical protein
MKKRRLFVIVAVTAFAVLVVFAWAPWVTNDYVVEKVVCKLGGSDIRFNYLGQDLAIKDIPKEVSWLPFGRYVVFPGEAGWYVSFYGSVS